LLAQVEAARSLLVENDLEERATALASASADER
jgi:hypothetical protein